MDKPVEEFNEEELSLLYMRVFNTDDGAKVLQDLKNRCFVDMSTIPEPSPFGPQTVDPYVVIKNEGRRSVFLHIQTQIKPFPITEEKKEE